VRYVSRVLIDDKNMNNIGDSASMLERYLFIIETRPQAFRDVFQTIAEADGSVLFHCFAGKDRTGLVAAMLLDLSGVPREGIAADYTATDVQLARQYEVWIDEAPAEKRDAFRDELSCPPERILGVLDHLGAKWGGVAGYLEASGVTAENIDRLSSKLA
jgi:protein-tyrosine phosphatase